MRRRRFPAALAVACLAYFASPAVAEDPDPYLAPTVEVHSGHPDIQAVAAELGTPLEIFKYVRNRIDYEVYYGSKKGALGTLWSGGGNDFDQASLLIALLRARGIRARYALSVIAVDADQLQQWAGVRNPDFALELFEYHYCYDGPRVYAWEDTDTPCEVDPPRFVAWGASPNPVKARMEHVWVEAELPASYRGVALDAAAPRWIAMDPSWKQKDYRDPVQLPDWSETPEGGCGADEICFNYDADEDGDGRADGYLSRPDPRGAVEIFEGEIQRWLEAHPDPATGRVATPEEVIYDGPIIPYEGEVLPASLPFYPDFVAPWGYDDIHEVIETADLGTLDDGIQRRFGVVIRFGEARDLEDEENLFWYRLELPALVGKRVTFSFEPTSTARRYFLETGGFLNGPYEVGGESYDSLFAYCLENPQDWRCHTTPVLKVDGVPVENMCDDDLFGGGLNCRPFSSISLGDPAVQETGTDGYLLIVSADAIPGVSLEQKRKQSSDYAKVHDRATKNPIVPGAYVAIGIDANQFAPTQLPEGIEKLVAFGAGLALFDEGDGDANGNGIPGEVLIDQSASGLPDGISDGCNYAAADAMTTCDIAIAAQAEIGDGLVGELLHLVIHRYLERVREDFTRAFALNGYAWADPPISGIAKAGFGFTYLFNQPVGVEPAAPLLDVKGLAYGLVPIEGFSDPGWAKLKRTARLAAHAGSALEHQVWEELLGYNFISTVKGFQLVRERFPTEPIVEFTPDSVSPGSLVGEPISRLLNHRFDQLRYDSILALRDLAAVDGKNAWSPIAAVSASDNRVEVYRVEEDMGSSIAIEMKIEAGGQALGGAAGLGLALPYAVDS